MKKLAAMAVVLAVLCLNAGNPDARAQPQDDHGDTARSATPISPGTPVSGTIGHPGDRDVFRIALPESSGPRDLWAHTSDSHPQTRGELLDQHGNRLAENSGSSLAEGEKNFHLGAHLRPGTYHLAVTARGPATGPYTLHIRTGADHRPDREGAGDLGPGGSTEGIIGPAGDADTFRVRLAARTRLIFHTSGETETEGALLDYRGAWVQGDAGSPTAGRPRNFLLGRELDPGTHYITVRGRGENTGPYRVHAATPPEGKPLLELGVPELGFISGPKEQDIFQLELGEETEVWVYTTGPTNTAGELHDPHGRRIAYNDQSNMSEGQENFLLGKRLPKGSYTVQVKGFREATGPYRLHAERAPETPDSAHGPPARGMSPGNPARGMIDPGDEADLFRVQVATAGEYLVYTTGDVDTTGELSEIRETVRTIVATDDDSGDAFNFAIRKELQPGTYQLMVQSHGNETGPYGLLFEPVRKLVPGQSLQGKIVQGFGEKHFRLDLREAGSLWVHAGGALDTTGDLRDQGFNSIARNDDGGNPGRRTAFQLWEQLGPGSYYLRVGSYGTRTGSFTVQAGRIRDHSGRMEQATLLGPGEQMVPGRIGQPGQPDLFRLDLQRETDLVITGSSRQGSGLQGRMLDALGESTWTNRHSTARGFEIRDTFGPGTHHVRVDAGVPAHYTLHVQEDPGYRDFLRGCRGRGEPLQGCQWHLEPVRAQDAWDAGYTGEGVGVAVVDDGMDHRHQDLQGGVLTELNHDYTGRGDVADELRHHGTAVSGLLAARRNGTGVAGVAPGARIYGYNYLAVGTTAAAVDAAGRNREVTGVSNNSWAHAGTQTPSPLWERAVLEGTRTGNGGRGTVYVMAAGNGARKGDHSNLDRYANHHAVTAVCAVNQQGFGSLYSERGANLWVCGPSDDVRPGSSGMVTTGNSDRYRDDFGGTSAAAAVVSGTAALVQEANPELSWRDVKLVLAGSARRNDPEHTGWQPGALRYGSRTENYRTSHQYGFGTVDAADATGLARSWVPLPPQESLEQQSGALNATVPDPPPEGGERHFSHSLHVQTPMGFTEHVEVRADIGHRRFRDLRIELTSPSGRKSVLSWEGRGRTGSTRGQFRFGSNLHLGEDPNGTWTLRLEDRRNEVQGTLYSWAITVRGHRNVPPRPVITGLAPEGSGLTVSWRPSGFHRGEAPVSYDVRHAPQGSGDRPEWTLTQGAWRTGDGPLSRTLEDMPGHTRYRVQVRAVNPAGPGPWSRPQEAVTGDTGLGCAGGAVRQPEHNRALVQDCETLLGLRDRLAGNAALGWEAGLPLEHWDGTRLGAGADGSPRITGLELPARGLDGTLPPGLGDLSALRDLDLSGNNLTGTVPPELSRLTELARVRLAGNRLEGCAPRGLRNVPDSDLEQTGLPWCDLLPVSLTAEGMELSPPFGPYVTRYTGRAEGRAVTLRVETAPGAAVQLLDQGGAELGDLDPALAGFQLRLQTGETVLGVRITSQDQRAWRTIFITMTLELAPGSGTARYDADGDGRISRPEAIAAIRDYMDGLITKEEVIAVINAYLFGQPVTGSR